MKKPPFIEWNGTKSQEAAVLVLVVLLLLGAVIRCLKMRSPDIAPEQSTGSGFHLDSLDTFYLNFDKRADASEMRINLHAASAQDLEALPGIGPVIARRIVDYCRQRGRLSSVNELLNVKGIGPKKLEKIAPFLDIQS